MTKLTWFQFSRVNAGDRLLDPEGKPCVVVDNGLNEIWCALLVQYPDGSERTVFPSLDAGSEDAAWQAQSGFSLA